jgi:hypothetical protein
VAAGAEVVLEVVGAVVVLEELVDELEELLDPDVPLLELVLGAPVVVVVGVLTVVDDCAATVSLRASTTTEVVPTAAIAARPTVVMAARRRPLSLMFTLSPSYRAVI